MAAVFSLGLSGYILRRLPETGAKFLDGENEGRLLVPEMGSAFSPDSPENSMLRSLYLCMYVCMYIVYIYISMSTEKRLRRPHTNFSLRQRLSPWHIGTHNETQSRLIPLSYAENVARSMAERWRRLPGKLASLVFSYLVAIRVYNHIDWNESIVENGWFKRIVARPIIVANCFR